MLLLQALAALVRAWFSYSPASTEYLPAPAPPHSPPLARFGVLSAL